MVYLYRKFMKYYPRFLRHTKESFKWIGMAILTGMALGLVGAAFYHGMQFATTTRGAHPWLIFLLPMGGLLISGLYMITKEERDRGTNLVLSAVHSGDNIPLRMAPLIFISTLITHFFGGSAGREGAALQMGGSIGNGIGRLFRFNEQDRKVMIMCGMAAAFSAVFGTPLAAAVFAMEVISVGIMQYSALLPCVVSALVARELAKYLGATAESFAIIQLPALSVTTAVKIGLLAILCGFLSILFCVMLHQFSRFFTHFFKNRFLRAFVGGGIVLAITLLIGNQDFNGTGMPVIESCFTTQTIMPGAFALKMLLTAITLSAGYKGGEIVPSFFIGATFGCLFGNLLGISPGLCAAAGMGAVFCGVTNCPITSLLICFELFGLEGMPYYLISIALSYVVSGYYGLYQSQKIMYSKYKTSYINRKTQ